MVTYMELHFAVRLLVVIAVLAPMLWPWRACLVPSPAVTIRH
jgi:hypothetical protein